MLGITAVDDEGRLVVELTRTALVRKASEDDTGTGDTVDPPVRDPLSYCSPRCLVRTCRCHARGRTGVEGRHDRSR